jgi:hypothetical protein
MRSLKQNWKWLSRLLAMALLVSAVVPAGAWRCLDGTLCPLAGLAPHGSNMLDGRASSAGPARAHSCCRIASAATGAAAISSARGCLLTGASQPQMAPTQALWELPCETSAPLPPNWSLQAPESREELPPLVCDLPPPPLPCLHSGRAPPFLA